MYWHTLARNFSTVSFTARASLECLGLNFSPFFFILPGISYTTGPPALFLKISHLLIYFDGFSLSDTGTPKGIRIYETSIRKKHNEIHKRSLFGYTMMLYAHNKESPKNQ